MFSPKFMTRLSELDIQIPPSILKLVGVPRWEIRRPVYESRGVLPKALKAARLEFQVPQPSRLPAYGKFTMDEWIKAGNT